MCLKEDIENIYQKDPAARSQLEVVLCYPGFHALVVHRLSNALWLTKIPALRLLARFISTIARAATGIEIHPGVTIGRRFFIDHGMGVVIGETTVIGDDVVIYQGVTLGTGIQARQGALTRDVKRHPTLGNGVVIGSSAQVLGDVHVGNNATVASGSIVLKNVPDNCVVAGVPGRIVFREGERVEDELPDIEAQAIKSLKDKIARLETKIRQLTMGDEDDPKVTVCFAPDALSEASKDLTEDLTKDSGAPNVKANLTTIDPVDAFLYGAGI